jgi:prepilin-type N-terminal cleavage/methylation domain-containing protein
VRRPRQRGFTIVELLVAMTLVTILIGVAFQIGIIVVTGYRQHRDAVAVQRAARGSLDLIGDAVRNASAGVPTGDLTDAAGCTALTAVSVVDASDGPDELSVITAAGGMVSSLRTRLTDATTAVTVVDAAGLAEGDLMLVTDLDRGHVVRVATPPQPGGGYDRFDIEPPGCDASFDYAPGSLILRARIARFFIDDVDGVPTLFLDEDGDGPAAAEPLAEGIEDLQVAIGVDVDRDGRLEEDGTTLDEWFGNAEGDPPPPPMALRPWRALRVTIVARTLREDRRGGWSARPTVENRDGGPVDGFRRRVVSTIVEIRNLEGSP